MQISLFDGTEKIKIDKPIRLIELFAGYGSQHLALKYLGVKCESWKICEWAVKSIQAYKDMHFKDDNTDYSKDHSIEFIINRLAKWGISANYNEPMTKEQIKRMGESKARQIYNNIKATHNLVNVQQAHAEDLEIVDRDKYTYMMTYSFPCQDLSKAGLGKGMGRDSGTRSGMLWEVERILDEAKEIGTLPHILLMKNVPDVIGTKNIAHFAEWLAKLESLGYKCYWKVLNAKDYGVPQNRERCFMVSILGDYWFAFPQGKKLEIKLKDILENEVDEKYYLTDKAMTYVFDLNRVCDKTKRGDLGERKVNPKIAKTISCRGAESQRADVTNFVVNDNADGKVYSIEDIRTVLIKGREHEITKDNENYIEWKQKGFLDSDCRAWKENKVAGTITTNGKTKVAENLKTQLCNELIVSGKVKENDVIRHSYSNSRMKDWQTRGCETNNMSPTLDTRCDCLGVVRNLRIRKLTPKECFRLMGVKNEDFERVAENQSNASLYHLAGDSIVVDVLMAIFKEMTA